LGRLLGYDGATELGRWWSLELPWKDNASKVSCIPTGTYPVVPLDGGHLGWRLWVQNVPNRSEICVHRGNYPTEILGCIEAGLVIQDINGDRKPDCSRSKEALAEMKVYFNQPTTLTVVNGF
jgi:hypothetical protein